MLVNHNCFKSSTLSLPITDIVVATISVEFVKLTIYYTVDNIILLMVFSLVIT